MTTYTHRNGETEPPTVEGRYWFKGNITDPFVLPPKDQYIGMVSIYRRKGMRVNLDEYGVHRTMLQRCDGQWWGPVTPPWEVE